MSDLTTPQGRLDVLVNETFPWSPEASTMACQTIRGLIADLTKAEARIAAVQTVVDDFADVTDSLNASEVREALTGEK